MPEGAAPCSSQGRVIRRSAATDMELMIGAGLALALLYFWLIGHWFARVVTFLAFGAGFVLLGLAIEHGKSAAAELACIALGFVAGWFVASLPTYYWRHQLRQMLQPY